MRLNDVSGNGQPQPRPPLALSPVVRTLVKPIKDPFHLLCRDPRPGVRDPHLHPALLTSPISFHGCGHLDNSPLRGEFHRIAQKVVEHLLDSRLVQEEQGKRRGTGRL